MNRTRYPSDLTDVQWQKQSAFLRTLQLFGRRLKWEMCLIVNAIFYVVKSGCQWRMLPYDMPPWQTVYYYIRKWKADNTWLLIHQAIHETR